LQREVKRSSPKNRTVGETGEGKIIRIQREEPSPVKKGVKVDNIIKKRLIQKPCPCYL